MKTERMRHVLMPWAGLALGTLGAGLAHQMGADSTFQDCRVGSPAVVVVGTILGLLLVGLGALGSWRVHGNEGEAPARRFVATVSLMSCGIFALAILLPFIASMVIPRCWH